MMQKYGPAELKEHYMVMDTICDATQERQTAVYDLVDKQPVGSPDTSAHGHKGFQHLQFC